MENLWSDLRYSLRSLVTTPAFAAVALVTMAIGIGANAAMFSVVNGVLLTPPPYADPARLVRVWSRDLKGLQPGTDQSQVSPADFADWQARSRTLPSMAAFTTGDAAITGDAEPEQVPSSGMTINLFDVLGERPLLGRGFTPEDIAQDRRVAVLGHALWTRRWGADPGVVGRTIVLGGLPATVVGVMKPSFSFPGDTAVWTPAKFTPTRAAMFLNVVARLAPGTTVAGARAEMDTIARALQQEFPKSNATLGVTVIPILDQEIGQARPAVVLLFAMVGLLLLIACVNLANLLVVRASTRLREFALRAALGAPRWRIVRQLLTESLLVGVLGGAAGLATAGLVMPVLLRLNPDALPRASTISVDASVLFFTMGMAILTGLLFGLAPALHVSRLDLEAVLRDGGRSGAGAIAGGRLRRVLIVCQIAVAVVVLTATGLLMKSFVRVLGVDPGFRPANVLTMEVRPSSPRYSIDRVRSFYPELVERIEHVPGVASAAATFMLPLGGDNRIYGFRIEGAAGEPHAANFRVVTPHFFSTMGMTMQAGRGFSTVDTQDGEQSVIVNQRMAERFWKGASPALGQRLIVRGSLPPRRIVGVVSDVRHFGLEAPPEPEMYVPHAQFPAGPMTLVVRTNTDPRALVGAIKQQVRELDPDLPVSAVRTMDDITAASRAPRRLSLLLLTAFAGAALLLATVGVYGVTAQAVTQRTREIGLRVALGAAPRDVLALVMRNHAKLLAAGIALGTAGALATGRLMTTMLFEVRPYDPAIIVGVVGTFTLVTLGATYLPARRALRVDPIVALGSE